jgi:hypothetical protein
LGIQLDNATLPEGSDELGNLPGQPEEQLDEAEERESDRSNLSFMKTPPVKVTKKPSQED